MAKKSTNPSKKKGKNKQNTELDEFYEYFNNNILSNWIIGFKKLKEKINIHNNNNEKENHDKNINEIYFYKQLVIRDPIWGEIKLNEIEHQLLDSFFIQRLRDISQMGGLSFIYPGANHKRFDHSLGTFAVISEILDEKILKRRSENFKSNIKYIFNDYIHFNKNWKEKLGFIVDNIQPSIKIDDLIDYFNKNEPSDNSIMIIQDRFRNWIVTNLKISMLLHDIGHFPKSHLFEIFLKRQKPIVKLYRKNSYEKFLSGNTHEIRTRDLILGRDEVINDLIKDIDLTMSVKHYLEDLNYDINLIAHSITGFEKIKEKDPEIDHFSLSTLVNGPLDADKMDYLARDNYYSMSPNQFKIYDRIYRYAKIGENKKSNNVLQIKVIYPEKVISSIMKVIITRSFEFKDMVNHPVNKCYESLLIACLEQVLKSYNEKQKQNILKRMELMDDQELFHSIKILGKNNKIVKHLFYSITNREFYKMANYYRFSDLEKFGNMILLRYTDNESSYKRENPMSSYFIDAEILKQAKLLNEIDKQIKNNPILQQSYQRLFKLLEEKKIGILLFFNRPDKKFEKTFEKLTIEYGKKNEKKEDLSSYINSIYKKRFLGLKDYQNNISSLFDFFTILDDFIYIYSERSIKADVKKFFSLLYQYKLLDEFLTMLPI